MRYTPSFTAVSQDFSKFSTYMGMWMGAGLFALASGIVGLIVDGVRFIAMFYYPTSYTIGITNE